MTEIATISCTGHYVVPKLMTTWKNHIDQIIPKLSAAPNQFFFFFSHIFIL